MTRKIFPALAAAALGAAALAPLPASAGGNGFWIAFTRTAPAAPVTGAQSGAPRFAAPSTGPDRDREATRPSISEFSPATSK